MPNRHFFRTALDSNYETTLLTATRALPVTFTLQKIRARLMAATPQRRYDDVFADQHRLYFKPLLPQDASETEAAIAKELQRHHFTVTDYHQGYCTDRHGKKSYRIGKLLKGRPDLARKFEKDPRRTSHNQLVVLSRHPYDIARMSTGRAWISCMHKDGSMFQHVYADIQQGTLVAYLIKKDDVNIANPLSRTLLKPYVNHETRDVILVPQGSYGFYQEAFNTTVERIAHDLFNTGKTGTYRLAHGLYDDQPRVCTIDHSGAIEWLPDDNAPLPSYYADGTSSTAELFDYLSIPYTPFTAPDGTTKILAPEILDLSSYGINKLPYDFQNLILTDTALYLDNNNLTDISQICDRYRFLSTDNNPLPPDLPRDPAER